MGTQLPSPKGAQPPAPLFGACLLRPNGWMDYATWYGGRPRPRRLCVRWGPSPRLQKGRSPQFSAHVYCGQMAGSIKVALGVEVGLSPSTLCYMELRPPPEKGAESPPQFSVHFCCGQTAGCIKMPLGMEVGVSTGDFVLDGEWGPRPLPK